MTQYKRLARGESAAARTVVKLPAFCMSNSSEFFKEDPLRQSQTAQKRPFHPRTSTPVPARANGQRGIKQTGLFKKNCREGVPPTVRCRKDRLHFVTRCRPAKRVAQPG